MLFLISRIAVTAALAVRAVGDVFASVGAAQRCAYAVELGRAPAQKDLDRLGIDARDVASLLRA